MYVRLMKLGVLHVRQTYERMTYPFFYFVGYLRCQYLYNVTSAGRKIDDKLIGNNLKTSGRGLIYIQPPHLHTGTEKTHEIPQ
jgi:hypothetical protein